MESVVTAMARHIVFVRLRGFTVDRLNEIENREPPGTLQKSTSFPANRSLDENRWDYAEWEIEKGVIEDWLEDIWIWELNDGLHSKIPLSISTSLALT